MERITVSEPTASQRRIAFDLVDDTDGKTPETGVTISAGDLKLSKNGLSYANAAGSWTEIGEGSYYYEATTSEVDQVGFLLLKIVKTGIRRRVRKVLIWGRPRYRTGVVNDASATTTSFVTDLSETGTDHWKDAFLTFRTGSLTLETRKVTGYNGTTKAVSFTSAWSAPPANGDAFSIVSS